MKLIIFIVGVFIPIAIIQADPTASQCSCNRPTKPTIRPRYVCYNINQLIPFCPPCIEPCAASCPCIFPDEAGTIVYPKPDAQRPPYCPKCEVTVYCIVEPCFAGPQPCTAEAIQRLINE